jgi:hypothetical protein
MPRQFTTGTPLDRHCEERSDAAIQRKQRNWVAALRAQ